MVSKKKILYGTIVLGVSIILFLITTIIFTVVQDREDSVSLLNSQEKSITIYLAGNAYKITKMGEKLFRVSPTKNAPTVTEETLQKAKSTLKDLGMASDDTVVRSGPRISESAIAESGPATRASSTINTPQDSAIRKWNYDEYWRTNSEKANEQIEKALQQANRDLSSSSKKPNIDEMDLYDAADEGIRKIFNDYNSGHTPTITIRPENIQDVSQNGINASKVVGSDGQKGNIIGTLGRDPLSGDERFTVQLTNLEPKDIIPRVLTGEDIGYKGVFKATVNEIPPEEIIVVAAPKGYEGLKLPASMTEVNEYLKSAGKIGTVVGAGSLVASDAFAGDSSSEISKPVDQSVSQSGGDVILDIPALTPEQELAVPTDSDLAQINSSTWNFPSMNWESGMKLASDSLEAGTIYTPLGIAAVFGTAAAAPFVTPAALTAGAAAGATLLAANSVKTMVDDSTILKDLPRRLSQDASDLYGSLKEAVINPQAANSGDQPGAPEAIVPSSQERIITDDPATFGSSDRSEGAPVNTGGARVVDPNAGNRAASETPDYWGDFQKLSQAAYDELTGVKPQENNGSAAAGNQPPIPQNPYVPQETPQGQIKDYGQSIAGNGSGEVPFELKDTPEGKELMNKIYEYDPETGEVRLKEGFEKVLERQGVYKLPSKEEFLDEKVKKKEITEAQKEKSLEKDPKNIKATNGATVQDEKNKRYTADDEPDKQNPSETSTTIDPGKIKVVID